MKSPVFLFILSGILFATLDAIAKILVQETNLIAVVWSRFFGQCLLALPVAWYFLGSHFWKTHHLQLQLFDPFCSLPHRPYSLRGSIGSL
jgi:hypothetical protein